jgi:multicomponent Na+:H+ antiporter subunit D
VIDLANLLVLPVALPVATALLLLILARPSRVRRLVGAGSALVVLGAAVATAWFVLDRGGIALRLGAWPVPFSIVLSADALSATFLAFVTFTALVCVVYGFAETSVEDEHPLRLPLVMLLTAGVNHALLTADLFNLFVAFEVMLVSSYALITLEADDREIPRALPYLTVNVIGSTVFLAACGLTYGWLGTLNLAEIAVRLDGGDPRAAWLAALLLAVVGIKTAMFPLFYWLPRSYPVLPPALAGLFGGLLTKVGVYVLLRLFVTVLPEDLGPVDDVLLPAALTTMVVGGLGALSRSSVQSILSWHIVSQIGFMVTAVALRSPLAIGAAVAITLHNVLVKSSLLLTGGSIRGLAGTDELARTGHLYRAAPWLAAAFLLQALSLAGLPPLSGFWGKLLLFRAGTESGSWTVLALAGVASFLTLASMLKIWLAVFWREPEDVSVPVPGRSLRLQTAAIGLLVAAALAVGLGAEAFLRAARAAAGAAADRPGYIRIVRDAEGGRATEADAARGDGR